MECELSIFKNWLDNPPERILHTDGDSLEGVLNRILTANLVRLEVSDNMFSSVLIKGLTGQIICNEIEEWAKDIGDCFQLKKISGKDIKDTFKDNYSFYHQLGQKATVLLIDEIDVIDDIDLAILRNIILQHYAPDREAPQNRKKIEKLIFAIATSDFNTMNERGAHPLDIGTLTCFRQFEYYSDK